MRRWLAEFSMPLAVVLFGVTQAIGGDWWTAGFLAVIASYLVLTDPEWARRVRWYRAGYGRGVLVGIEAARDDGHFTATGHPPTPGGVPTPPPTGEVERVTPAQLLMQAAQRLEELQAVVDGLDELLTAWERSDAHPAKKPGLRAAARMLRGYLARPPIHAQETTDG